MTEQTELMKTDGTTIAKTNGHDIDMGRMFEKVIDKLSGPGAEQAVVIMERLVAMQLDVNKLEAEQSFNRAFARFQATVPNIPKTKHVDMRGGPKWDYPPIDVVMDKIKPTLKDTGLSVSFTDVPPQQEGNYRKRCIIIHVSGHSRFGEFEAPPDNKNPVSDMHKAGGVDTYCCRRALLNVLGLVAVDAANDAENVSGDGQKITENQVRTLSALISEVAANEEKFLAWVSKTFHAEIVTLEDIPANRYNDAVAALEQKRRDA
jgi:DNA-directed RNA polymerase subunit N (RpoN/RPB10)